MHTLQNQPIVASIHLTGPSLLRNYFRHSNSNAPPLRIGVMLDSDSLIRPFAAVIEDICNADFTKLVLRIYNHPIRTAPLERTPPSPFLRITRLLRTQSRR